VIDRLSADPVELLQQLDDVWDAPSAAVRMEIEAAAHSNDVLLRQAAVEALGRLGNREPVYIELLGDPSKLVERTAAWAMRQAYSRYVDTPADIPTADLANALASANDRTRWGATRVFAAHFSALAKRPEMASALAGLLNDPSEMVRMGAVKGIWQFWFWTPAAATKSLIEDRILAALAEPQTERVERNLRYAVYNLADENIRYLYNNWVPLLGRPQDRERAIRGRLEIENRLATKFAEVLTSGSARQKTILLESLTSFPMRRGDIYDLDADLGKPAPPIYNRIGNDTEQIEFFGQTGDDFARALQPLLDSPDATVRRLAAQASLLVRETRFPEVNRVAGPYGADVKSLIAKLRSMPDEAEVVSAMQPAPATAANAAGATATARRTARRLDEAFFRGYVQPILERRGKDGYACVNCHATHTLFDATWSTVRNVVDTDNPEQSLILRKPTSSSDTEGIAGSKTLAHGGGIRFSKDSPEYTTILDWIKGAKE
jgi:hypothetical protein